MACARSERRGRGTAALLAAVLIAPACGPGGPSGGGTAPAVPELGAMRGIDAEAAERIRAAHRALAAAPGELPRWVELGRVLDAHDMPRAASEAWGGASALDPEEVDWAYFAGAAAKAADDAKAAEAWFERAVAIDAACHEAWRQLGCFALDAGELAAAEDAFAKVVALRPDLHDGHTGLALVALAADRPADGLRHAEQAARAAPGVGYPRHLLASLMRALGRDEEAAVHATAGAGAQLQWAERSSANRPDLANEVDAMLRGDQLAAAARLEEAAAMYRRVLAQRPEDGRVRVRLGVVLAVMGKPEEGLAVLDEALAGAPRNYGLMLGKAEVLALSGREPEARRVLDEAIRAWPDRADAWLQLGALEEKSGRAGEALRAFERAAKLEPANVAAIANTARALLGAGRAGEAADLLERGSAALDAAPPLEYFQLLLAAQARAGRGEAALRATRERAEAIHGAAARALSR